ncbi:hypothetical protein BaRGS_00014214 [Batillaria attramentaria]|uniref:VWFA domain-containing protein n=1 Tax=Batillaria attramentaria TaxID=370345 RepID=A0ABD0L4U7_9CAEN
MNFASPYVYDDCAEVDAYEAVSDEEFNEGMEVSDSSSDEEDDAAPTAGGASLMTTVPPAAAGSRNRKRVFRRADTNVVTVRFDTLKTPSAMHAGEVVMCSGCQAILSHISKIEEGGEDKVWKCEFCDNRNIVDVEEEEKPTADDVTFLVEPSLSTTASGPSGRDESLVIFCVDISGSMCVTSEVPGYMKLRGGSQLRRVQQMSDTHEDQFLPHQRRDVTYISRLQAVQAAVDHQLGEMCRDYPHRRVGLVAFNCDVTVIGDGTQDVVTVTGDKLKSVEELTKLGSELPAAKAIKETRQSLGEKVFALEEGGPTALGPALVVALSMASHQPGSKVIICTDGKANVGLGKLEDQENPGDDQDPSEFYESIADTANTKGVSVSVITIKGTDCKLVNIVDPLKLREEFSNILADRIIATGVVATFILHRGLYINSETNDESKERREIGNVTSDTEISFEYGVRKRKKRQPPPEPPMSRISEVHTSMEGGSMPAGTGSGDAGTSCATGTAETDAVPEAATSSAGGEGDEDIIPSELPFQLQITYADTDGTKALRVITQKKPVTRDRQLAEENADLTILGVHTTRLASELALRGEYTQSRGVALMNQRLAWRSTFCIEHFLQCFFTANRTFPTVSKVSKWLQDLLVSLHSSRSPERLEDKKRLYRQVFNKVKSVENVVGRQQQREQDTYGRTHSDDEEVEDDMCLMEESDSAAPRIHPAGINQLSASSAEVEMPPVVKEKKLFKKKMRSADVDDNMAQLMYKARSTNSSAFRPPDSKK